MPSPFPGMDPFIECQKWPDFHHEYISSLRAELIPAVRPRYVVDVEHYVYLSRSPDEIESPFAPDVSVVDARNRQPDQLADSDTATMIRPVTCTLPMPQRNRQAYLVIRDRQYRRVVTVIELLSPRNKSAGDGIKEYLTKRNNVLASEAHLVELDLLRGGSRLPTVEALPPGDFYVFVCRRETRPQADLFAWPLAQRLPFILVPLADDDSDVTLDLQKAFDVTYDRAGYDYSLDYELTVSPPLRGPNAAWVRQVLDRRESSERKS